MVKSRPGEGGRQAELTGWSHAGEGEIADPAGSTIQTPIPRLALHPWFMRGSSGGSDLLAMRQDARSL